MAQKSISSFLNNYFFSVRRNHPLGLIRIGLLAFTLLESYRIYKVMSDASFINPQFDALHQPGFLIDFLHLPFPIPQGYAFYFAIVYYAAGLFALAGLFTRPALAIFSIMTIYISDVLSARGFFNHEASLSTQVLLLIALAPGATSFSIDNIVKWVRNKRQSSFWEVLRGPAVPVWGLKAIMILLAVTYITAGWSKLRYGGMEWMDGETLTHYLDGSASPFTPGEKPMFIGNNEVAESEKWKDGFGIVSYSYGNRQKSKAAREAGHYIASHKTLIKTIAITTVIFELAGFVILFGGWASMLYLVGAILMHKSIGHLMNLSFISYQLLCLLLIDWTMVYRFINKKTNNRLERLFNKATATKLHTP